MKCVSVLSTARSPREAIDEAVAQLLASFGAGPIDLAFVFASPHHAEHLSELARRLRDEAGVRHLAGCTGESIIGGGDEVEGSPALSVWAASLPGHAVRIARIGFDDGEFDGLSSLIGGSDAEGPPNLLILLGDPFSFPADACLKHLAQACPGLPIVGGMASGSQVPGGNRFLVDDAVHDSGAVGVALRGPVGVRTVVSQGCRPVGRTLIVTRAERNIVRELGRRPAMEVLREIFDELTPADQVLLQEGLHVGRVINEYQETFRPGDFLVRNVLGADDEGGLAVTDIIRVGQTVQFHVRDADSAHKDLLSLLEAERSARPAEVVRGALVFSCNGRGTRLFPGPNHDVGLVRRVFGPVAAAGFFAMGEIGPVGGQNFMHGFTASIALFSEPDSAS